MNRKQLYGIAAVMLVALLSVAGCSNPLTGERKPGHSNEGLVVLRFSDLRMMHIIPEISLDIDRYEVSFTRQGFQPVTLSDMDSDVTETEPVRLLPGPWQVALSAFNGEGTLIGFAAAAVSVAARQTSTVAMAIQSLVGDGTLSLTADLDELELLDPAISGTLTSGAGATTPISMEVDGSSASFEEELAAGTYLLTLELTEDGTSTASYVNTVLIVYDQPTTAALAFRPAGGSVVVELLDEITHPSAITLDGLQPELSPEDSMTVSAVTATEVDTHQWYLDGKALPGEVNNSITLGPGLAQGAYLLTVVVRKGELYNAKAAAFRIFELITYRSQSRYVEAVSGEPQRFEAMGFEDFDATATSTYEMDDPWEPGIYTSQATQTSTLARERIFAAGEARYDGDVVSIEDHYQSAESRFVVHFSLNQRAEVRLTGGLDAWFDIGGTYVGESVAAVLFNGGEPVFEAAAPKDWEDPSHPNPIDVSETLILEPGDYTLSARAFAPCQQQAFDEGGVGAVGGDYGWAQYSIEMSIVDVF